MKNVKEQIDSIIKGRAKAGLPYPRYLIIDPASRAKLLRICRSSGDSIITTNQIDQTLRYGALRIAVVKTPETLIDVA